MQVTCYHEASKYGVPVILNDSGEVLDYAEGLTQVLKELGWSRADLAQKVGKSPRSIERYWQGVDPPANLLNVLEVALDTPPDEMGDDRLSEVARAHHRAERLAKATRQLILRTIRARYTVALMVSSIKDSERAHNKFLEPVLKPGQIRTYLSLKEYKEKATNFLWSKDIMHRAGILFKKPRRQPPAPKWEPKQFAEPSVDSVNIWAQWARNRVSE